METKNNAKGLVRRDFLKSTAKFAAATMFFSVGGFKLSGANNSSVLQPDIPWVTLINGVKMPILGFGTFMLRDELCKNSVRDAITLGYRLIDTATVYGNEKAVGDGIKESGISRKELFITSKVWIQDPPYDHVMKEFQISLDKLGTDYLDLYLIHRPRGNFKDTWKAMEELYDAGKIRAIGISNFEPSQLEELKTYAKIQPAVNQIETHAFFQEQKALENLNANHVQMEAWAPFAEGRNELFTNEVLASIGKKYDKTNAQVSLRWHFQRNIVAIPRSSKKEHMIENLNIFDFKLDDADLKTLATLDLNKTQFPEW
jgi:2,5-diketo-D-gluconate reductase A